MICNYCDHEAKHASGMLNSSEDSPEIEFWHCENCNHAWMDEQQQKDVEEKQKKIRTEGR